MNFEIKEEEEKVEVKLIIDEKIVAKATCYFKNTPQVDKKQIGTIGEFEIENKEVGTYILKKCDEILKQKNVKFIVAPMNGNTWKKYRTLKYTNGEPMFILENVNPIEDNEVLLANGFEQIDTYTSTEGLISDYYDSEALDVIEKELENENITIKKFNKSNYIEELNKIYNVSIRSFCRNPFYTPINKEEFMEQYIKYIQMVDEDFILIAEKDKQAIGFVFCIPNFNEMKEKGKINTLILKTIAVNPEYEEYGIGNVMLRRIAQTAQNKNYEKWIFAFMYSHNTSQKMAKRNKTEIIREYALYGKEI